MSPEAVCTFAPPPISRSATSPLALLTFTLPVDVLRLDVARGGRDVEAAERAAGAATSADFVRGDERALRAAHAAVDAVSARR